NDAYVLSCYSELTQLVHLINSTFELEMTIFLLQALLYYSVNMNAVVRMAYWQLKPAVLVVLMQPIITLVCSAEACHKMHHFRDWLSSKVMEGRSGDSASGRYRELLERLKDNPVCFRGRLFSVSYSLLINVTTYGIVLNFDRMVRRPFVSFFQ